MQSLLCYVLIRITTSLLGHSGGVERRGSTSLELIDDVQSSSGGGTEKLVHLESSLLRFLVRDRSCSEGNVAHKFRYLFQLVVFINYERTNCIFFCFASVFCNLCIHIVVGVT
ncbi:hypothetical protein DFH29DRAFT_59613 [Suillus ampliporus]|nr:hypothetical protein DFH29DRAFT_59613 [Suillus ampliporus]